jgi:ribonuclease HI
VAGKDAHENEFKAFYAVAVGDKPGIYPNWTKAEAAIGSKGGRAVKQKKFETLEEAKEFIRTYGGAAAQAAIGDTPAKTPTATKKSKAKGSTSTKDGDGPDVLHVWTDGASAGNGRAGAKAGFGVFFGNGDKRYGVLVPTLYCIGLILICGQERLRPSSRRPPD